MGRAIIFAMLAVGVVGTIATIANFSAAMIEMADTCINKFKKAGIIAKAAIIGTSASLGLAAALGVGHRLNEVNKEEDRAYKFAYAQFEQIEKDFLLNASNPSKEIANCFKDAAGKAYAKSVVKFWGSPKEADLNEMNKHFFDSYALFEAGSLANKCLYLRPKDATNADLKAAQSLGESFFRNVKFVSGVQDQESIQKDNFIFVPVIR